MPVYPFACGCGHKFDRLLAVTDNLKEQPCPGCGKPCGQDYSAKKPQVGMVDGPTSGYFSDESGFPRDPSSPTKRIVPNKQAWKDHLKRNEGKIEEGA